jgi:hypothetical protein
MKFAVFFYKTLDLNADSKKFYSRNTIEKFSGHGKLSYKPKQQALKKRISILKILSMRCIKLAHKPPAAILWHFSF